MSKNHKKKDLSSVEIPDLEQIEKVKVGVVVSEWNEKITGKLLEGCRDTLIEAGVHSENLKVIHVPGSFELPFGAKLLIGRDHPDAVICLGCVIQGETKHNEYINMAVSQSISQLSLFSNIPIIYGVLTPDTMKQAEDRAGGKHGNKGVEAAATALRMIALKQTMKGGKKKIGFG